MAGGEFASPTFNFGTPQNWAARLDDGKTPGDHQETAEDYFWSIYFEALLLVINLILDRFIQPGYKLYSRLESLLVNAV